MEKDGAVFYERTGDDGEPQLWFKQRYGNAGTDRKATAIDIQQFDGEYRRYLKLKAAAAPLARFRAGIAGAQEALDDLNNDRTDGDDEHSENYENADAALEACAVFADMIDPDYEAPADDEESDDDADETKTKTEAPAETKAEVNQQA